MDGVIRTRVGYAGGTTKNPTYHQISDHTETLQVDYDADRISYRALLHLFWTEHRPLSRPWSRQYMSAVFCNDQRQFEIAEEVQLAFEDRWGAKVHTKIRTDVPFYRAEEYHQKYRLQQYHDIVREMEQRYPSPRDFIDSPTATRLNAFLGGALSKARFSREVDQYGLTPETATALNSKG